jgi:hypothetical protein
MLIAESADLLMTLLFGLASATYLLVINRAVNRT